MEDILIDTDIVIEYLRSTEKSSTELIKLLQKYDVLLSSISEFELYLGAKTERHQNDLEMLFSEVEVISFDFGCGNGSKVGGQRSSQNTSLSAISYEQLLDQRSMN